MSYENTGGYHIRQQSATHFLTFTVVGWIDIFTRDEYKRILLESFEYCRKNKGLKIHAFVIMSNHVHTIWTAVYGNLSDVVRDFKSFTSRSIVNAVLNNHLESRKEWLLYLFRFYAKQTNANDEFKFWRKGSHPEQIFTPDFFYQKLEYIHNNPVRAKWVDDPTDYLYSSARNFSKKPSLFRMDDW